MKRIALFIAAFAVGAALAEEPKVAHRGTNPCDESKGQVWTCTIQCDPGVRSTRDSIFQRVQPNNAGVEICAVRQCGCAANWSNNWPDRPQTRPGFLAQDSADELAVVVFGIDRLLGNMP